MNEIEDARAASAYYRDRAVGLRNEAKQPGATAELKNCLLNSAYYYDAIAESIEDAFVCVQSIMRKR